MAGGIKRLQGTKKQCLEAFLSARPFRQTLNLTAPESEIRVLSRTAAVTSSRDTDRLEFPSGAVRRLQGTALFVP